jgi:hypothetical protein
MGVTARDHDVQSETVRVPLQSVGADTTDIGNLWEGSRNRPQRLEGVDL